MFNNPYNVEKDFEKLINKGRVRNINQRQFNELQAYAADRGHEVESQRWEMMLQAILIK